GRCDGLQFPQVGPVVGVGAGEPARGGLQPLGQGVQSAGVAGGELRAGVDDEALGVADDEACGLGGGAGVGCGGVQLLEAIGDLTGAAVGGGQLGAGGGHGVAGLAPLAAGGVPFGLGD